MKYPHYKMTCSFDVMGRKIVVSWWEVVHLIHWDWKFSNSSSSTKTNSLTLLFYMMFDDFLHNLVLRGQEILYKYQVYSTTWCEVVQLVQSRAVKAGRADTSRALRKTLMCILVLQNFEMRGVTEPWERFWFVIKFCTTLKGGECNARLALSLARSWPLPEPLKRTRPFCSPVCPYYITPCSNEQEICPAFYRFHWLIMDRNLPIALWQDFKV